MSIERDLELFYEVGCLRFLDRTWKQFLGTDFANVAEHTLRVLWLSLILAKKEKCENIEMVMKMALVHDLSESRAGDVHYLSRQFNQQFEDKAIAETLKDTMADDFLTVWQEYERRECLEAKIVKDADNLDVELELKEQEAKGNTLRQEWLEMRKKVLEKLYTISAKNLWQEIQNSNPNDWHKNGSNRFKTGDWKV